MPPPTLNRPLLFVINLDIFEYWDMRDSFNFEIFKLELEAGSTGKEPRGFWILLLMPI